MAERYVDTPARRTVRSLMPGDLVEMTAMGPRAVFVARTFHPIWTELSLVVWRLDNGTWSHDALDPRQEVGVVLNADEPMSGRRERLTQVLVGGGNPDPAAFRVGGTNPGSGGA